MKFIGVIAAFAAVASAQSVTSTASSGSATGTSTCAAQNILDACKGTIQGQIDSCGVNDWSCLCEQYGNLLTCYNNCPGDQTVATVQSQHEQYCNFASVYSSSSTKYSQVSTTASATSTSSGEETAQTGFASASGSQTTASTTQSGNGAAATQIAANLVFAGAAAAYMFL